MTKVINKSQEEVEQSYQENSYHEVTKRCPHNDCGWCYYRGDGNPNDTNGACNNAETCEVLLNE